MMFTGIDEYTVERTTMEPTALLWIVGGAAVLALFFTLFGLLFLADVWKNKRARTKTGAVLLLAAGVSAFLFLQSSNPAMRVETEQQKSYLVVTGESTWTEVVRDEYGDATELLMRVDEADDWLLQFTGDDIDRFIGRDNTVHAQCRIVSDERMRCSTTITGAKEQPFGLFGVVFDAPERDEGWGEPRVAPYKP